MDSIIDIIVFVLVLGSIIFIHELGHFVAAKSFGVYCSEFALGMGPKILSKKGKETLYSLRALPVGGFVAMYGENDQEGNDVFAGVNPQRSLKNIKTYQKVIVMLAGVFMNFLMAFVIIFTVYSLQPVSLDLPVIGAVVENSPAQEAGLSAGDQITTVTIQETTINPETYVELVSFIQSYEYTGTDVLLVDVQYSSGGDNVKNTTVAALYNETARVYQLGIEASMVNLSVPEAFESATKSLGYVSISVLDTLGKLITGDQATISQVSGPVGIFNITSQVRDQGTSQLAMVVAMLSANIGIFNLLPIPGLDGSQVIFALVEKAIGKEIPLKIRYALQLAGLALVFGLMILITVNDISKIFR